MTKRTYDRKAIFAAAHAHVAYVKGKYAAWQIERGIHDASFKNALKVAWFNARKRMTQLRAFDKLNEEAKALVALKQQAKRDTIYLPAHMSMSRAESAIQADINAIVGIDWFDIDVREISYAA